MNTSRYRTELIHTAACCLSALEDLDTGHADYSVSGPRIGIVTEIYVERRRQSKKWSEPLHREPEDWLRIIMEELGEAAEEIGVDFHFSRADDLDSAANSLTPLRHCSGLTLLVVAGRECRTELEARGCGTPEE